MAAHSISGSAIRPLVRGNAHRHLPQARMRPIRKPEPLWYAICFPQFRDEGDTVENRQRLRQLAELVRHLSAKISILPPDAIVFEVRSSLRYFGGIANIRSRLHELLEQQWKTGDAEPFFCQSAAPTATGSTLLARNGANVIIYQAANLRSALGRLPLSSLPMTVRQQKQLRQSGLIYLRDLWRLPGASLRQQFGNELVDYLDRCLGRKTEVLSLCEPLPAFSSRHELEYPVEYVSRLLPVIQELLAQLCAFLRQRGLCTTHLLLQLEHEAQTTTTIEMNLRRPARSETHLLMLLENRSNALALGAPVTAVSLEAEYFDEFVGETRDLLTAPGKDTQGTQGSSLHDLLEQLQARLGNPAVRTLQASAEQCPEFASGHASYGEHQVPVSVPFASRARPCWLLAVPQPLQENKGRFYTWIAGTRTTLEIISEPERIDTRWWAGADIRRDYYVAMDKQGRLMWIFHARSQTPGWYLHGIF